MNLKQIITAKNAGFRTKQIEVSEWQITVIVREPLHIDFNRYIKSIKEITEQKQLTDEEKDSLSIKAEARLFADILLDDKGDLVFKPADLDDLIKNYGPVHTRIVNEAISLIELGSKPIEEAEKK